MSGSERRSCSRTWILRTLFSTSLKVIVVQKCENAISQTHGGHTTRSRNWLLTSALPIQNFQRSWGDSTLSEDGSRNWKTNIRRDQTAGLSDEVYNLITVECAEKESLRREHQASVASFRAAIRDLIVLVENSATDSGFDLAHLKIRVARGSCELAKATLAHHQIEHHCSNST